MLIQKAALVGLLRQRGQDMRADWVERELPAAVDTYNHAGLLDTLRVSATDLAELIATAQVPEPGPEPASEPVPEPEGAPAVAQVSEERSAT